MKTNDSAERFDVYQLVTDRMIELLENGVVPWRKPWVGGAAPVHLVSKKPYRGANVWLLGAAGYSSPYWVSYKQAADLGGHVRKGEKSSLAVFWKLLDIKPGEAGENGGDGAKTKKVPVLRYYRVFNLEQCDGIQAPVLEAEANPTPDFEPIAQAEQLVQGMPDKPAITHNEARAYYARNEDRVNMPKREAFVGEAEYYATLFHELVHSTGHDSRLARLQNSVSGFGSTSYAKEELVAEMGASYLCALAGIENATIENAAAYIQNWLSVLKNDRKLVVNAAAAAQKAVDFITAPAAAEEESETV